MKIKSALLGALAGAALFGMPLQAAEMTKSDVEQIVRDYLLNHPEILVEMSNNLRAKQESMQAQNDKSLVQAHAKALFANKADPQTGNPDGSLTIVEFFDYNCGYCKRAHPLVAELLKKDKDIRYIYKQFPILTETSYYAARVALAVQLSDPSRYMALHEKLIGFNGPLNDEAQVQKLAKEAGVNWDKVKATLSDPRIDQSISQNRALAEALGVSGTPAFIVGDQILRGAPRDLASLEEVVKEARNDG